jgi:hypothetical protein
MNDPEGPDEPPDAPHPPATRSGYTSITAPDWAHKEMTALLRELSRHGVTVLPPELRTEAEQLLVHGRRPFTAGVVVGIACRALRLDLAAKTSAKTSRK